METLHDCATAGESTRSVRPDNAAMAILEEMARCGYLIDRYREGIALKSRRIAELESKLSHIEDRA